MNIILFSGFLGSGKTSLIISLAHFLIGKRTPEKPEIVIIENEIGEIGIDDKILKAQGFTVKELFAGCICCQLTSDLTLTLNDLAETINPRWVIIEATGLAFPSKILNTIHKYAKDIRSIITVTVIDAERWEELSAITPELINTQIKEGNILLISKTDLVTTDQLNNIEANVKELNPKAAIHKVISDRKIDDSIWEKTVKFND